MKLRIACVQYDSRIGQVERNIQHVDRLLTALRPEDVDILLLPEMAFTGYVFASKDEVDPLVEDAKGPTVTWAAGVAQKLRCHVQVGFPERDHASGAFYNSAAIVTPGGAVQDIYRKHFLYETDYNWAAAGEGFKSYTLSLPDDRGCVTVCPAICMDLNPKDFIAPFDAFEFGTFAKEQKADIVLCSMNWLASENPQSEASSASSSDGGWSEVTEVLSYWATRLSPLVGSNTLFVGCNRVGTEKGITFTGSSCVIRMSDRPSVIDYLGKSEEGVLLSVSSVVS